MVVRMQTREEIHQEWINKNKESEVRQAKFRAKQRLEGLSDEEKTVLASLKQMADKVSVKTVGEMYSLLQTIEAD